MARSSVSGGWIVVFNDIPVVMAVVEARARSYPKKKADDIWADAKSRIHRVTGELQDTSYTTSISAGKSADIVFPSDHAAPVEYGTYKMSARPYLNPAIEAHQDEFFSEIFSEGVLKA